SADRAVTRSPRSARRRSATAARDPNRLPGWFLVAVALPPTAFLAVLYAWPLATIAARGFAGGALADTLGRSDTWRAVWFTAWQAVASTVLTVVVGTAPAWAVARFAFP